MELLEAYKKAISIKPDYAEAYYNTGNALTDKRKVEEALISYKSRIDQADYAEAYYNIGIALNGVEINKPDKDLQKLINIILDQKKTARPKDIAKAAISLLKFEPLLQKHLRIINDEGLIQKPLDIISDLSKLPLLLKLMCENCPLPDLEVEGLFKKLRFTILLSILDFKDASSELLRFQSSLALQCFTNEYIYNQSEEEGKVIQTLEKIVKNKLENNEQPSPQIILSLASYKALDQYEWCNALVITDTIREVFFRQIEGPKENLKSYIPVLEEITDNVSSKVRDQYEENPYPRWVNLSLPPSPVSLRKMVSLQGLKLHSNKIEQIENPNILIAGCGTGQHSITTAAVFEGSKVLAIDLSLSSLAYAKLKTDELALNNIDYMQADILDLGKLRQNFDIIESAGVLHHMENPMAWLEGFDRLS